MTTLVLRGPCAVEGSVRVPGDKSISHRALMLASVAEGASSVRNLAPGEDVSSTIRCLESYGVHITRKAGTAAVDGKGMFSWTEPAAELDCGNSGTTMRLLAGFAAHCGFTSTLDGDPSLRRRPMDRLVNPLGALGARVETTDGHPPISVRGGGLRGAKIETGIASAQVKSCALFAALGAEGHTSVIEPALSRDHTERLLAALGARISESVLDGGGHRVDTESFAPPSFEITVPGDPSSAAFLVAAAVLAGHVDIADVGVNPTRNGFIDTLARMGAAVDVETTGEHLGEPVGTISARRSQLGSIGLEGPAVPKLLDELPLLAVVATQAKGTTTVRGAQELRVKESDRIASTLTALRLLGADAEELPDGFKIHGPTTLIGTKLDAAGDHRLAMALAVAGLVAHGETLIDGFEAAAVSWPGFEAILASLGVDVETR